MKRLLILAPLWLLLTLPTACEERVRIEPARMEASLKRSVYNFNKDVTGLRIDVARSYVAPEAEEYFESLVEGILEKRYNLLLSGGEPRINFSRGRADVSVNLFQGRHERTGSSNARLVEEQKHHWRLDQGVWQWYGPSS